MLCVQRTRLMLYCVLAHGNPSKYKSFATHLLVPFYLFPICFIHQGYLLKKGHVRRNWQERWFVLKPSSLIYYVNEDLKEKKGEVLLEESSVNLPDKEGRRCLFCVNAPVRTYEMSASNMKQRVDWVQGKGRT
uniref:PH domain-containing protein n=1 Tax=Sinocyclocheilus rhinocerous TaxID=307959 RepID=A0A673G6T9_9TELE